MEPPQFRTSATRSSSLTTWVSRSLLLELLLITRWQTELMRSVQVLITTRSTGKVPVIRQSLQLRSREVSFGGYLAAAPARFQVAATPFLCCCLLYTSDAADERSSVDLGG